MLRNRAPKEIQPIPEVRKPQGVGLSVYRPRIRLGNPVVDLGSSLSIAQIAPEGQSRRSPMTGGEPVESPLPASLDPVDTRRCGPCAA